MLKLTTHACDRAIFSANFIGPLNFLNVTNKIHFHINYIRKKKNLLFLAILYSYIFLYFFTVIKITISFYIQI